MICRVCKHCGAMLPDDYEAVRRHTEWHARLVRVLALVTVSPTRAAEVLEQMGKLG
ncbi:hypothetical protein LCGC14_1865600 [marine sediment metagenome]|uniref:Uncharacterized protein n=1 Tax=marine sediment metagenome TaxID=412755 RepID=A0A0F9G6L7_9ZZZZ